MLLKQTTAKYCNDGKMPLQKQQMAYLFKIIINIDCPSAQISAKKRSMSCKYC